MKINLQYIVTTSFLAEADIFFRNVLCLFMMFTIHNKQGRIQDFTLGVSVEFIIIAEAQAIFKCSEKYILV